MTTDLLCSANYKAETNLVVKTSGYLFRNSKKWYGKQYGWTTRTKKWATKCPIGSATSERIISDPIVQ